MGKCYVSVQVTYLLDYHYYVDVDVDADADVDVELDAYVEPHVKRVEGSK